MATADTDADPAGVLRCGSIYWYEIEMGFRGVCGEPSISQASAAIGVRFLGEIRGPPYPILL